MIPNAIKVRQSDGDTLSICPGDVLWKSCDRFKFSSNSSVENTDAVIALMYLGKDKNDRLVFSVFSARSVSVKREGSKFYLAYLTQGGTQETRITLGTLKIIVNKMRNMYNGNFVDMEITKHKYNYIVLHELLIATEKGMGFMKFAKTGLRITDMRHWPSPSILTWGQRVLGLYKRDDLKSMSSLKDNESLIAYIRKMTASTINKKNKKTKLSFDLGTFTSVESPEVKYTKDHILNTGNIVGLSNGLRWVYLGMPRANFLNERYVVIDGEMPHTLMQEKTLIFDNNADPILVTLPAATSHHEVETLRIDSTDMSIGLCVMKYRDDMVNWLKELPLSSAVMVDYNVPEEATLEDPLEEEIQIEEVVTTSQSAADIIPTYNINDLPMVIDFVNDNNESLTARYYRNSGKLLVYTPVGRSILDTYIAEGLSNSNLRTLLRDIQLPQEPQLQEGTVAEDEEEGPHMCVEWSMPDGITLLARYNSDNGNIILIETGPRFESPDRIVEDTTMVPRLPNDRLLRYVRDKAYMMYKQRNNQQ